MAATEYLLENCCQTAKRLYFCTNCCEKKCILHFIECVNYQKCRSNYCLECYDDMEKNSFVKLHVYEGRMTMICPMCMDDVMEFASSPDDNYYTEREYEVRESEGSGLKSKKTK